MTGSTNVTGQKGVGGSADFTATTHLAGMWPFNNGTAVTDRTVTDTRSGVGTDLKTKSTENVSAGFWGTPGRGTFGATNDRFGNPSFTEYELGTVGLSFIFSFRINAAAGATGVVMAKRDQATGIGQKILLVTGVLRHLFQESGGSTQNLITTTNIADGTDYHVVLAVDKTGDRVIYVNGVDDFSSGTKDMTSSTLDGDATSATYNFMLGSEGAIDTGSINLPLYDGTHIVQLWDCHLYTATGALPTLAPLVAYLKDNIYSPIPASLW